MTNEDNNHDTKYIKYEHEQPRRAQAARVSTAHRARCLVVFPVLLMMCHTSLAQVVHESVIFTPCHDERFSFDLTYLPSYFDLSFPVFLQSSVLMHPDLHTDLDNLDSVENNLRHSAQGEP